jgi:hypothetical protein
LQTSAAAILKLAQTSNGRASAQAVSLWLPTAVPSGFNPMSGHVGFVVDKVALGHDLSEYFGFACQFSFHRMIRTLHHSGLVQQTR